MLSHQMSSLQEYHSGVYNIPTMSNTGIIITLLQTAEAWSHNKLLHACLLSQPHHTSIRYS